MRAHIHRLPAGPAKDIAMHASAPGHPPTDRSLEQELAFLVRWLEATRRDHSYPLERAHYLMLLLLMADGPQSTSQIAERLRLDSSTVTRQVSVMAQRGLVRKQPNPQDRRGAMVCASAAGEQEATRMRRLREEKVALMVADWPESKKQALVSALGDLNVALCEMLDGDKL
ncbi:MarR family transcriptional regulator [Alcanivorax hongdengensis A-11-3]|uniref:MarR family transcriptional regulator n=1 Tax=Alcanivorax hongdengensis A-11-3 TaxID=1177179 RepID=L0WDF0_9GAMM|nr:MarR family winged helix-turn-helix transcriptional regulator [Alcanivorax hongdengensis]EKF74803.1 MarR family transcriptional regulator [Alcanivorax hongdengensis A-11-3]